MKPMLVNAPYVKNKAYKASGVDIDAGNELVKRISPICKFTYKSGVISMHNGFAGLFDISKTKYKNPVLVCSTDGVGSKVKLAIKLNKHNTIGQDLVAMCVNDVLCCGGEPILFFDYFSCNKLDVDIAEMVIDGIAAACTDAGCALLGGETAEMPNLYQQQGYELAGFAVGLVEKDKHCGIDKVESGNKIIGLSSSGMHANGYSLLHSICDKDDNALNEFVDGKSIGELAIIPTVIYVKHVLDLIREGKINALAHITGGGIIDNLMRVIPDGLQFKLCDWTWPPLFSWLQKKGNVSDEEMLRVFNCGIGMAAIVSEEYVQEVIDRLSIYKPVVVGGIVSG